MSISSKEPLRVLVVGAGVYVCGRGTNGYGTILPALYQTTKEFFSLELKIAATRSVSVKTLKEKDLGLQEHFGFALNVECVPKDNTNDEDAYQKVIEEGWLPDCAIVCVPDHLHFDITSFLLKRGVHCLVVKPLAPTVEEVQRLVDLAEAMGVYGAVEFHKRFDRSNLKLRDTVSQGVIGEPLYWLIEYSQRKSIPIETFQEWVKHTNIFQYLGIHYLDIIYFATRAMPRRAMAIGQKKYLISRGIDTYDSIQGVVEWEMQDGNRFSSTILTNWIDPEQTSAMSEQRIKVIGTRGRFEADQKNRGIYMVTDDDGIEEPNPDFSSSYGISGTDEFSFRGYGVESILQFLKDVRQIKDGGITPEDLEGQRPTFKEALVPTLALEAANQSLGMNGAWVTIPDDLHAKGKG